MTVALTTFRITQRCILKSFSYQRGSRKPRNLGTYLVFGNTLAQELKIRPLITTSTQDKHFHLSRKKVPTAIKAKLGMRLQDNTN